jgi:D-beta-D-heptose 7-phosphate kinase/D-beta-D-heptose 1-phosphate adenosyltransferase
VENRKSKVDDTMKLKKLDVIKKFSDLKVIVLGDVMLDIYDFCYTSESKPISSEKPGKRAYKALDSIKTLGGAGNVAANLSALGVSTVLISVCGKDGHYFTLQELADKLNIHHFFIQDRSRSTTTKTRLYIDDEYLLRRDDEVIVQLTPETTATLMNEFQRELKGTDAVILSDYNKGFFNQAFSRDIISLCNERSVPVVVDFKPANKTYFKGADIIVPNRPEAESMQPGFLDGGSVEQAARSLYALLECPNLVITLGSSGLCGFDGSSYFEVPANQVEVTDGVGCGDTVRACLALGFALGLSLHEAGSLANDAAAVVLQKVGTATLSRDELTAFIEKQKD